MLRTIIIIFSSFFISNCYAQDTLDFGRVKPDTAFDCKKYMTLEAGFGISSICNSKNQFELRLTSYSRPKGGAHLIILTYNNQKWDVKKYQITSSWLGNKLTTSYYQDNYDRVQNYIFKLVLDSLKNYGALTLPDQETLNLNKNVMDGGAYRLTFKVNSNFRSYWFENPESYSEDYPEVIELKKYAAIVKILNSLF